MSIRAESIDELMRLALQWRQAGRAVAIATVVQTWGSAPRQSGSVLICDDHGQFAGSVSGGCVEISVIEAAREVLASGIPRLLEFGVADETAWAVGLACGGRIRVWVEALDERKRSVLTQWLSRHERKETAVLAIRLTDGEQQFVDLLHDSGSIAAESAIAARSDRAVTITDAGSEWFLLPLNPPLRLVIIGAVHIAEALVSIARLAGYEIIVVDPRGAFARSARFESVTLLSEWPATIWSQVAADTRTAIVALTHDPKIDDPALRLALASEAFYIGALGSKRTHEKRIARLLDDGVGAKLLNRIHAPIGLDIGARSPMEIAISILAEMTAVLRGRTA
jgi:xanthine dehydrogenase accessory factor